MMNDDSIPDEQVHLSDDEDTGNDHLPKADLRKDWWKPLPEEERPATPEPAWTIPSSNVSDVENNWASALVSTYEPPAENSLLAKTGDMTTFMNWYCQKVNKTVLTQADFEGQAYEVVKAFYPNVIHLQFQMEECHKMLTDQINWANPEDLEYLRYGNKGSRPALSISKMKAARYPDFGLELLVPEQMWIDEVCTYDISAAYGISHWWFNRQKFYIERHDSPSHRREVRKHMRILSVVRIKAYSRYGYDYLSEIVLRRADFQEHKIAEKDFKNLYPSDFEDLNLLLLQGHLDHLPGSDKRMLSTAVKLWTQNLVIRQRVEDFQLGIESYQTQLNLTKPGWDAKGFEFKHDYTIIESPRAVVFPDVTRSKEFMSAIERRLKTRRIYRNLECFVGGRVRDIATSSSVNRNDPYCIPFRRSKYENKGKVPTEMELELEQTQQGSSHEVSVSIKGVEERKRNVREKVAVRSSLRSLKPKRTIESRAKRSSINLIRTLFHITCSSHNVKTRVIIRVLRIILVVLPEHPSDTYVFTMKMEILLEPTSNKLMAGKLGDSDVYTLEDPTLILEILSRRFFLRLNLPDHRSVLTGSGVKMEMEIPRSSGVYFITACLYSIDTSNGPHESSSICFKASATPISKSS
ncbi:hypothetical protein Tco_0295182 [Tanacetum coccineum]